jgi:hypothetical protein
MGTEMMWGVGFLVVMAAFIWWKKRNSRDGTSGTWTGRQPGDDVGKKPRIKN